MNDLNVKEKIYEYYGNLVQKKLESVTSDEVPGAKRFIKNTGKKLRPSLVVAIAASNDKSSEDNIVNAASAIELVHLASLVHDDIIDNGKTRHGVPTINAMEGSDFALLAGDHFLAKSCLLAAEVSSKAAVIISSTITKLIEGQALELKDNYNLNRTKEDLMLSIQGKTASLFTASCEMGAIVSGLSNKESKILINFAKNLGMCYQLKDDINDFYNLPEKSGKTAGKDIQEGKYTLPVILSLESSNNKKLKKLLKEQSVNINEVIKILESNGSIEKAKQEAEKFKKNSLESLDKLGNSKLRNNLRAFTQSI